MSAKLIQIVKKTGSGSRARRTANIQSNSYGAWESNTFSSTFNTNLSGYRLLTRTTTHGTGGTAVKKTEKYFYSKGAAADFRDDFNRSNAGVHNGIQTFYTKPGSARQNLTNPATPPSLAIEFDNADEAVVVEIWENARVSLSHDNNNPSVGQFKNVFADDFEENLVVLDTAPESYKSSFSQTL